MTALYRKYRPQDFDEVVGQEAVTRTLKNAIAHGQIRQAYLFAGPLGTGKTSPARILAKAGARAAPRRGGQLGRRGGADARQGVSCLPGDRRRDVARRDRDGRRVAA